MTEQAQSRADVLFEAHRVQVLKQTNRVFAVLMVVQWAYAIGVSLLWSPWAWAGKVHSVNVHVWAAVILGGLISSLPIAMITLKPLHPATRHVVAAGQVMWSALLIHLTGGRIETHFHVFGSLAFLAFYRDWRVLVTATVIVATDHLLRGMYWPESVYGVLNPEWWRFIEHALWVVFEDTVLVMGCFRGVEEMHEIAVRQAEAEEKSVALDGAMGQLKSSQEALVRTEKLAAVGQLAASVGHELRNPLGAIRNAHTFIAKKLEQNGQTDPKVTQFIGIMEKELAACSKIIGDLLDFARERPPQRGPCPLKPLVDDAIGVVPKRAGVELVNEVPEALPIPNLDKDQFRQVLVNLVQNASEAIPPDRPGKVAVRAEGGGERAWTIRIVDNGAGIPADVVEKIFQPLFTTKTKGTGLGLAIVANMVTRHDGTMTVESEVGKGTTFVITLPADSARKAAA